MRVVFQLQARGLRDNWREKIGPKGVEGGAEALKTSITRQAREPGGHRTGKRSVSKKLGKKGVSKHLPRGNTGQGGGGDDKCRGLEEIKTTFQHTGGLARRKGYLWGGKTASYWKMGEKKNREGRSIWGMGRRGSTAP